MRTGDNGCSRFLSEQERENRYSRREDIAVGLERQGIGGTGRVLVRKDGILGHNRGTVGNKSYRPYSRWDLLFAGVSDCAGEHIPDQRQRPPSLAAVLRAEPEKNYPALPHAHFRKRNSTTEFVFAK